MMKLRHSLLVNLLFSDDLSKICSIHPFPFTSASISTLPGPCMPCDLSVSLSHLVDQELSKQTDSGVILSQLSSVLGYAASNNLVLNNRRCLLSPMGQQSWSHRLKGLLGVNGQPQLEPTIYHNCIHYTVSSGRPPTQRQMVAPNADRESQSEDS